MSAELHKLLAAVTIRRGTLGDWPAAVALGRKQHAEGWYSWLPYDDARCMDFAELYASNPNAFFAVAESDDRIVGMMLAHMSPYFFCDAYYANHFLMYIDPEYRRGMTAVNLCQMWIEWAYALGAQEVFWGQDMNGMDPDILDGMAARLGMTKTGAVYRRKLK